jgi:hypothetical protein
MVACDPGALGGMAAGPLVTEALERQRGLRLVQCRWRYGDRGMRRTPFEPHVRLAGVFTDVDGRVGLGVDGFDGWSGWEPGDHKGCLCSVVPVYR